MARILIIEMNPSFADVLACTLRVEKHDVAVANTAPDGKGGLVVGVTEDRTKRFNAVVLVRKGAEALGGKGGGGRPDMAQAGGPDGSKADAALAAVEAAISAA